MNTTQDTQNGARRLTAIRMTCEYDDGETVDLGSLQTDRDHGTVTMTAHPNLLDDPLTRDYVFHALMDWMMQIHESAERQSEKEAR